MWLFKGGLYLRFTFSCASSLSIHFNLSTRPKGENARIPLQINVPHTSLLPTTSQFVTMADDAGTAEEAPITFIVKTSTDKKYTMTLPLSTLVSDLKKKLETALEIYRYGTRNVPVNDGNFVVSFALLSIVLPGSFQTALERNARQVGAAACSTEITGSTHCPAGRVSRDDTEVLDLQESSVSLAHHHLFYWLDQLPIC